VNWGVLDLERLRRGAGGFPACESVYVGPGRGSVLQVCGPFRKLRRVFLSSGFVFWILF